MLGVSLKMYFSPRRTVEWCTAVAELARRHRAVSSGAASLFVLPAFSSLTAAIDIFADTAVSVGAQDLFWEDRGPYTGEVSGTDLRDLGCSYVEVGHAERRYLLGEDDAAVNRKLAAAARNSLTPVLCIGEHEIGSPEEAAATCIRQLEAALDGVDDASPLVVAYEPNWAIGAEHSASADHVAAVSGRLRDWLRTRPGFKASRVIYGGSAGPGLLETLGGSVDGLFLGRFAHDPAALELVLDEALALSESRLA
jgi:triosephosphate isomerase